MKRLGQRLRRPSANEHTRRAWLKQAKWYAKRASDILSLLTRKDDDGAKLIEAVKALRLIANSERSSPTARGVARGALRRIKVKS